eukprot:EG_transcript_9220
MAAMELFPAIGEQVDVVETTEAGTMEIESMCPRCRENGVTRMMLTMIPFFREVIVSSFECLNEECNEKNTFVQFGGAFQEAGAEYVLRPTEEADLSRAVIRSDHTTVAIPELDFEIPPQFGEITTVEGLLSVAIEGLEKDQSVRRIAHPEVATQIDAFIIKLKCCLEFQCSWTLKVRDPSGNAYIQNPNAPNPDPKLHVTHFQRSQADDIALGLAVPDDAADETPKPAMDYNTRRTEKQEELLDDGKVELGYTLPEVCFACKREGEVKLAMVNIPHFKETVIMSFSCEYCGFKSNEVKSGGAIPDHGTRLTLKVQGTEDLSRDLLKSHTCSVCIPELELELQEGSLGSMFTTVEGLLSQMKSQLENTTMASFSRGDSSTPQTKLRFNKLLEEMEELKKVKRPWTLVLDDALSHSYLQSLVDAPEIDPQLTTERYQRTEEQDEDLGITALREQEQREATSAANHT